jgi:serine protease Do
LIAINLTILAAAGIYASRRGGGIAGRSDFPDLSALIKPIPLAGRTAQPPDAALSTREVVARSEAAVAQIKGRFGSGSGFLVGPGLLATNAHVVAEEIPADLRVYFPSRDGVRKGPYRAALIVENVPRDIALLRVDVPFPPLPLASPYRFRRGEDVTIIGSPAVGHGGMTLENAISRGVLSTEIEILGRKFFQLGASVNPGNSGGPVIDSKGDVVGVVTLKAGEESIGFCVPVDDLAEAVERARAATSDDIHALARCHAASAVFRSLLERASLCAVALQAQSKRIEAILRRQGDADDAVEVLKASRDRLTRFNADFDDGYRVAVSELLIDPVLPTDLRRDLRDLWSTCDDMSRLALDPQPNLYRFGIAAESLVTHFGDLVKRLKKVLDQRG